MDEANRSSWLLVIPARLESKRLPRKPLIKICGKTKYKVNPQKLFLPTFGTEWILVGNL